MFGPRLPSDLLLFSVRTSRLPSTGGQEEPDLCSRPPRRCRTGQRRDQRPSVGLIIAPECFTNLFRPVDPSSAVLFLSAWSKGLAAFRGGGACGLQLCLTCRQSSHTGPGGELLKASFSGEIVSRWSLGPPPGPKPTGGGGLRRAPCVYSSFNLIKTGGFYLSEENWNSSGDGCRGRDGWRCLWTLIFPPDSSAAGERCPAAVEAALSVPFSSFKPRSRNASFISEDFLYDWNIVILGAARSGTLVEVEVRTEESRGTTLGVFFRPRQLMPEHRVLLQVSDGVCG